MLDVFAEYGSGFELGAVAADRLSVDTFPAHVAGLFFAVTSPPFNRLFNLFVRTLVVSA